ncbi:MAG: CsgG/HfaB family protein [Aquabacterium sp.]|uniref:CsgG/HfaB family protein n=1 Tax=Aquabacterium sp. TaxID=1872578 RepID=UPI0027194751|nr:CsgG/HfaB family protein [Aquabacterium sp.]MDO9006192.1 CsgG/HfaB family protein [Aquabacterium sp.]
MHLASHKRLVPSMALATSLLLMSGCSTGPTMGENKGVVTGAAGGSSAEGQNSALESCGETLGTLAIEEDTNAPWYYQLRERQLGSTVPVLRMMIQQSNCFVIVERGRSMNSLMRERDLARGEESRAGSNFGKGQMVAADYTMAPSIQFSGKTGGGNAFGVGGTLGMIGALAGSVSRNEASTTLLLLDNRSGVQISASEGSAKNFDFGGFGALFGGGGLGGGGGYSQTPQGKIVVAAFADSYNQMVKALRNYKAQTVKGGLGTGGRLGVQGGDTAASKEIDAKTKPKPVAKPKKKTQ